MKDEYPLGPVFDFLQRLWQLNQAMERMSSGMEKRLGVTAQQRLIIRCVGRYPGLTAGRLARLLHLDPGTVSASLARLEKKGLLHRRKDPRDARRASLGLSPEGRLLDRPDVGTIEAAVERLLEATPPRDLNAATAVIGQLTGLLRSAALVHSVERGAVSPGVQPR
ncbi:MAG: MarR family transcriptional regulator [Archangium sp.]|nr:MarR family transcriptional regulator [Archangium sp.]